MILGDLYLPLSLRGDQRNIGGHKKKRYYETARGKKKA
jgi:hypothetical protein